MRNICIHHNDLDGHCSAAVVGMFVSVDKFIEMDYDKEFPWEELSSEDNVYMVDFSFPNFEKDMPRINDLTNFHWIDHHKTAIEKAQKMGFKPSAGMVDNAENFAGCELTWKYLSPDSVMPKVVYLCGRFDVWDHEDPEVLQFHYGLEAHNTNPTYNMNLWNDLLNPEDNVFSSEGNIINELIEEGKIIQRYVETINERMARENAFVVPFEGHKFLAINHIGPGSKILEGVFDEAQHDGMLVFGKLPVGGWKVGLYAGSEEKIDCGEIAKKYKGGGHFRSSGFVCKELPFKME